MPAPETCKCAEVNSRRYDSIISRVQRLQSELETLQDQVMAPMQELQVSIQDAVVKAMASQLAEHEQYMTTTLKKMLDSRSLDLEQHVTGTVAQLHADLEVVHQDLAWVAEQVDASEPEVPLAQPLSSQPQGYVPVAQTVTDPAQDGHTFDHILVKTPDKPNTSPQFTPAARTVPTSLAQPMPPPRAQLPKTDESPTYDGKVESSHGEFS